MSVPKSSVGVVASIAGAVVSFCTAFIRSMTVVEDAVGMAEASVKVARRKQAITLEIEEDEFATREINAATIRKAKSEDTLKEYVGSDEDKLKQINETRQKLADRVNRRLKEIEHNAE